MGLCFHLFPRIRSKHSVVFRVLRDVPPPARFSKFCEEGKHVLFHVPRTQPRPGPQQLLNNTWMDGWMDGWMMNRHMTGYALDSGIWFTTEIRHVKFKDKCIGTLRL